MKKIAIHFKSILRERNIILILIIVTLAYYGQVLLFDFLTFDDDKFITLNEIVTSDHHSFADCFKYEFKKNDYFPLTFFMFRLLRVVFGLNPFYFHLMNLLLHTVNVVLIFFLFIKVIRKQLPLLQRPELWAGFFALLFSVHPLHVETVSWAIDLKDVLYSVFYISAMLLYWRWLEKGIVKLYLLSLLFAVISILSKSTAITFLAILFWIDWINGGKFRWKSLIPKVPFLLLTLAGFYIFGIFSNPSDALSGFTADYEINLQPYFPASVAGLPFIFQRVVIASFRFAFWFVHFFIPLQLNLFYTRRVLLDQYAFILPVLPMILVVLLSWLWIFRSKLPVMLSGILFFVITLSPAFAKADTGLSVFVPDRYLYLPLLGLLLFFMGLIYTLKVRRVVAILVIFFGFWTFQTLTYLPVWKDSYKLYAYCLAIDPMNDAALFNRSICYIKDKNEEKAFEDLNLYIQRFPDRPNYAVFMNRGIIYKNRNEKVKALEDFNKSIEIKSDNFQSLFCRGNLYLEEDSLEKARKDFSAAYDVDSTNFFLNKGIASLYNKSGNFPVALQFAEKCLAEKKDDMDLLRIEGISLFYLGRTKEATAVFDTILENNPELGEIWYLKSIIKFSEKKFNESLHDLQEAKKCKADIDVKFVETLNDSIHNRIYN